ncbi:hypothetical protein EDM22_01320 [Agromyces tardus]|uniref:Uncharacterized protein n=1 Tax=Agromyces tardus TaxID=2583849 RepID=A0A3M8AMQ8_9MICO|nr:hypothetical protein EDM22_01320 [Agromyces tardus]
MLRYRSATSSGVTETGPGSIVGVGDGDGVQQVVLDSARGEAAHLEGGGLLADADGGDTRDGPCRIFMRGVGDEL